MRFLPFSQRTVAAVLGGIFGTFLGALFLEVATSTPQAARGLFTVASDMAEILGLIALSEIRPGSVSTLTMTWLRLDNLTISRDFSLLVSVTSFYEARGDLPSFD